MEINNIGGSTTAGISEQLAGASLTPEGAQAALTDVFAAGEENMMKVKIMTAIHDMIMEALRAIKM